MATLPKQTSEAFKRLNPSLYAKEDSEHDKRCHEFQTANPHLFSPEMQCKVGADSSTRQFTIHTEPVPAPRMVRSDRWRGLPGASKPRRPCVQRYFDFRDAIRDAVGDVPLVPDEVHAIFHIPMPDSWSKSRRQSMEGKPHRQRGDGDNYFKGICDALFLQDGGVWKGTFEKRWAVHGKVELTMTWHRGCP